MLSIPEWHEIFKCIYGVFIAEFIGLAIISLILNKIKNNRKNKVRKQVIYLHIIFEDKRKIKELAVPEKQY